MRAWDQGEAVMIQCRSIRAFCFLPVLTLCLIFSGSCAFAATTSTASTQKTSHTATHTRRATHARKTTHARRAVRSRAAVRRRGVRSAKIVRASSHRRHRRYRQVWTAHSYTDADLEAGDVTAGEDPVVRRAAIQALGNMNGTVVAIDPADGRILAMVNQKLALSGGAEPCSTIKLSVALAALEEGIVTKDTQVKLGRRYSLNMTEALAHSNNAYFATLGRKLGFERVRRYAHEFGLGELAGWHIEGEQLGTYPDQPIPERLGGVGKMCSFGEGVSMTPLQLGALVAAIANGGTLYYLQHPESLEEVENFQPRVKRQLDIANLIPQITDGMQGAVNYGTARSLRTNFTEVPIFGKTGTCSNGGTRLGWFASYADTSYGHVVVVFLLEGGRQTYGPKAADLSGLFYRELWDHSYFTQKNEASAEPASGPVTGVSQ